MKDRQRWEGEEEEERRRKTASSRDCQRGWTGGGGGGVDKYDTLTFISCSVVVVEAVVHPGTFNNSVTTL